MVFGAVVISLLSVWILIAVYLVYSMFIYFWVFPERAKMVFCKDCSPSKPSTIRYKYIINIFLSNWSPNYDTKNTTIYIELITKGNKRMVSLSIKPGDIINKRARLLLHRKKVLRPLTGVRAIHDCSRYSARVWLSGIKVEDLKYGSIIYYTIDRYIYFEKMTNATVHKVLKPDVEVCSEQVWAPNFVQIRTDTYSLDVISKKENEYSFYGMVLRAEIYWFEDCLFVLYFMISIFYFNICFALLFTKYANFNAIQTLILSSLLSSCLSFNGTNIWANFYRTVIKINYNKTCSQQLKEMDKDSVGWTLIKNLSLTYMPITSLLISLFINWFVEQNTYGGIAKQLGITIVDKQSTNETLFLIIFFAFSLFLSLTLWLTISALINYIMLSAIGITKDISFESLIQHTHITDDSLGNDLESTIEAIESKGPTRQLGTDKLEHELYTDMKDSKKVTKSVIVKPNQSLGWINPEKFRIESLDSKQPKTYNTNKS